MEPSPLNFPCGKKAATQANHFLLFLLFTELKHWRADDHVPVVHCEPDILGAVVQGDMCVLGAQLDVLAAGAWHREGKAHGLKLLRGGFIVTDVHEPRDKIFIDLSRGEGSPFVGSRLFLHPRPQFTPDTQSREASICLGRTARLPVYCACRGIKEGQRGSILPEELKKECVTRKSLKPLTESATGTAHRRVPTSLMAPREPRLGRPREPQLPPSCPRAQLCHRKDRGLSYLTRPYKWQSPQAAGASRSRNGLALCPHPDSATRRRPTASSLTTCEYVSTSGQPVPLNQTPGDAPHALCWAHKVSHLSALSLLEVTSLRSAMVRLIPASCFQTGSARFRLRGLPVRMAIPSNTPARSKHKKQEILGTDDRTSSPFNNTAEMSSSLGSQCLLNQHYPNSQRLRSVLKTLYPTLNSLLPSVPMGEIYNSSALSTNSCSHSGQSSDRKANSRSFSRRCSQCLERCRQCRELMGTDPQ